VLTKDHIKNVCKRGGKLPPSALLSYHWFCLVAYHDIQKNNAGGVILLFDPGTLCFNHNSLIILNELPL
jgi:hypothetical protein